MIRGMRGMRAARACRCAGLAGSLLAALSCTATGCASTEGEQAHAAEIAAAAAELESAPPRAVEERLDRLCVATAQAPAERFWAAWLLAQLHAAGSADRPFRTELTRAAGAEPEVRASTASHLLATLYHAGQALAAREQAQRRASPPGTGSSDLPPELLELGPERAAANLELCAATACFRLGFEDEARRVLERTPELLRVESCLELLERTRVRRALRPWVCAMVGEHLRGRDELLAYRFGVLALEGAERFGQALPAPESAAIEAWILRGASVRFVCPESGTPYLPGERRSPVSGVPHLEYVAAPRPRDARSPRRSLKAARRRASSRRALRAARGRAP